MPPIKKEPLTAEQKVKKARQIATKAINEGAQILADHAKTRSTATRGAYKVRSEALEQVARVLSGKE